MGDSDSAANLVSLAVSDMWRLILYGSFLFSSNLNPTVEGRFGCAGLAKPWLRLPAYMLLPGMQQHP